MHTHTVKGSIAVEYYGKKLVGEDFSLNEPAIREMYQNLFFYFSGSAQTTLDRRKSIMLIGNLGVGKSILMRVMNLIFTSFKYVHAKRGIERMFKEFGEVEVQKNFGYDFKGDLLIDDVGTEGAELFLYKNKINLVGQLLLERYDLWLETTYQGKEIKTHITTNLSTDTLGDLYGERNYDRFKEMFNVVVWTGASFRGKK
jgi:DNA replication protein DnaC